MRRALRNIQVYGVIALATYVVMETSVSLAVMRHWLDLGVVTEVYEGNGATLRFDPVRGFRLPNTPLPYMAFDGGNLEVSGDWRGNNQGYPDALDFPEDAPEDGLFRVAVLGDSFTAAPYPGVNWTNRVNERFAAAGIPVRLMNFAVYGAGLANWWGIVTKEWRGADFGIDAVVFAVFWDDLYRKFCHYVPAGDGINFGEARSWEPDSWPKTEAEARRRSSRAALVVPPDRFATLWESPPRPRPLPYFSLALYHTLWPSRYEAKVNAGVFEPGQRRLMEDIASALRERGLPAMVASLPPLGFYAPMPDLSPDKAAFAAMLNAKKVDGAVPFHARGQAAADALYYPRNQHWNQEGSDLFAEYMAGEIRVWVEGLRAAPPSSP